MRSFQANQSDCLIFRFVPGTRGHFVGIWCRFADRACVRACELPTRKKLLKEKKTTFLLSRVSAQTAQMVFDVPCGTHCRLRFLGCIARELRFLFFSPLLMLMLFFFCLSVDMRWIHGLRIAASIAEQPELESVRSCNVYDN